jgi:hypothetical protein
LEKDEEVIFQRTSVQGFLPKSSSSSRGTSSRETQEAPNKKRKIAPSKAMKNKAPRDEVFKSIQSISEILGTLSYAEALKVLGMVSINYNRVLVPSRGNVLSATETLSPAAKTPMVSKTSKAPLKGKPKALPKDPKKRELEVEVQRAIKDLAPWKSNPTQAPVDLVKALSNAKDQRKSYRAK